LIQVRKATINDIIGIQQVAHLTWHSAYEHTMRPDTRAQILAEFYNEQSLARSLEREEALFLVAEEQDRIIGFVQALPRPCSGYEITRIYILPQWQQKGVGSQLYAALVEHLPNQALSAIVQRDHQAAIAFFKKHGFVQQRELELPVFGETLTFVELARQ
jgi:ribosomal protein S18 acetylase RimI-like enzyme